MQKAVPAGVGAMAAILKLPLDKLEGVLAEAARGEVVTPANFNSPDQIVIAGHAGAVKRASDLAKAAGAKRAVPLPVSAPFHCPLMKPAQDAMRPELEKTTFSDLRVPLINNWQAAGIRSGAEAREGLIQQIPGAVRWAQSMQLLGSYGVDACVEVGAGSVLTGLLRTIQPNLKCYRFGEANDLGALREAK
jgi:[acyl-carrier-protein] S-malonyltransferase